MSQLNQYSGVFAKTKAMRNHLLTEQDYEALLAKRSVLEIASYLRSNTSYKKALANVDESNIHRGELERMVRRSVYSDFMRLCQFLPNQQRRFLQVYIVAYEIVLLKRMLRRLGNGTLGEMEFKPHPYYEKHLVINVPKLLKATSSEGFLEGLRGTPYHFILSPFIGDVAKGSLFRLEMALDVYYYKLAWKLAQKLPERDLVKHTLGMEIDMLNIMWVMRAKQAPGMSKEMTYAFLLPNHHRLTKQQLVGLVESRTMDEFWQTLAQTKYSDAFDPAQPYPEQAYHQARIQASRQEALRKPFSIEVVLDYLHCKEIEQANLTRIIEGVRYQLAPQEIASFIIRAKGEQHGG